MKITRNNIDELNATIKIEIEEVDYEENLNKKLKKYAKKVQLKGFRPGKVPVGIVKKMYGDNVKMEEVNKVLQKSISDYLADADKEINIFGDILPNEKEQPNINIKKDTNFVFAFDIGIIPKYEVNYEEMTVPKYNISIEQDIIDKQIESIKNQFGNFVDEENTSDKSKLTIDINELDKDGNILNEGIKREAQSILIDMVKDKEIKKQLIDTQKEEIHTINLKKAYPNEADLSGLLGIDKEKVKDLDSLFQIKINKIEKYVPGELNQELYDKAFGKDNVKTYEEFIEKVREQFQAAYSKNSDSQFNRDIQEKLLETVEIQFPDEFIQRWQNDKQRDVKDIKERKTKEKIKEEYPEYKQSLKWHHIKKYIIEKNKLEVTEDDILEANKQITISQFAQYGMPMESLTDEILTNIVKENMKKQKDNEKYYMTEYAADIKMLEFLKTKVIEEPKEVTIDEFQSIINKINTKEEITEEKVLEEQDTEKKDIEEIKIEEKKTDDENADA